MLLTTNQTLMFASVLEVSGDPLGERQKPFYERDILKMPRTDETGRLAPDEARLRKIKCVTSITKTFRERESEGKRIYNFCSCQSILLSRLISRLPQELSRLLSKWFQN